VTFQRACELVVLVGSPIVLLLIVVSICIQRDCGRARTKLVEPPALAAPAASSAVRRGPPPGQLTYCPGPGCALEAKARAACEGPRRPVKGVFSAEPDFVCRFGGDVHRIVCDDVDDERQCGIMSHSDLEYARAELGDYALRVTSFWDMDFQRLVCDEHDREIVCEFPRLSTGRRHEHSPIRCNWMGCNLTGGDDE